ncbi:MAG: DUF3306 domain-containing protein [Pseudomonadota bacterium]
MTSDDTFLNRWSRRKRQADQAAPDPEPSPEAGEAAAPDPGKTDAEILQELGLSDPDTMEPGDDFSGFMAKAVPERLRNRALRKLWLTNPVLANLDELVDYGEDFTDAATVIENLQTVYRVGQGMIDRTVEEPASDSEDPAGQEPREDMPAENAGESEPLEKDTAQVEEDVETSGITQGFAPAEEMAPQPAPRRMAFRFEE